MTTPTRRRATRQTSARQSTLITDHFGIRQSKSVLDNGSVKSAPQKQRTPKIEPTIDNNVVLAAKKRKTPTKRQPDGSKLAKSPKYEEQSNNFKTVRRLSFDEGPEASPFASLQKLESPRSPPAQCAKRRLLFPVDEPVSSSLSPPKSSTENCVQLPLPVFNPSPLKNQLKSRPKNLASLRAQLASTSNSVARIERRRQKDNDYENELYSQQIRSPVKQAHTKDDLSDDFDEPTYDFHDSAATSSLLLPASYNRLLKCFQSLDVCTSVLYRREQRITLANVQSSMQQLTKHDFTAVHLAQIKTVYPESYHFHYEESKQNRLMKCAKIEYELVICPNVVDDLDLCPRNKNLTNTISKGNRSPILLKPISPQTTPVKPLPFLCTPSKYDSEQKRLSNKATTNDNCTQLSGTRQMYRSRVFRQRLLDRVKNAHLEYCKTLNLNIDENIHAWHKNFKLESLSEIECANIPNPHAADENTPKTGSALLSQIKMLCETPKNIKRIELPKDETPLGLQTPKKDRINRPTKVNDDKSKASGISISLLEKIRMKEQANKELRQNRDETNVAYKCRLEFAQKLVRSLRILYTQQNVHSLPYPSVVEKIAQIYPSAGRNEIIATLKIMANLLPDWYSTVTLHGKEYVKLNRSSDPKSLLSILANQIQK